MQKIEKIKTQALNKPDCSVAYILQNAKFCFAKQIKSFPCRPGSSLVMSFSIFCQTFLHSYHINQRLNEHGSVLMIQISQEVFQFGYMFICDRSQPFHIYIIVCISLADETFLQKKLCYVATQYSNWCPSFSVFIKIYSISFLKYLTGWLTGLATWLSGLAF